MARYTFGTTEAAAQRLEKIAAFFNPLSSKFIQQHASAPRTVVDLGCGPGWTTQMLDALFPKAAVIGLDKSAAFLIMAQARVPRALFLLHDITVTPFPAQPEFMYARSLLSHLPEPAALVNRWVRELAPRGVLMIEELEDIRTEAPLFRRYLETNTALIASQAADLFVGRALGEGQYDAGILCNEPAVLPVPAAQAASWFLPNVANMWPHNQFVQGLLSPKEQTAVRVGLEKILKEGSTAPVTWVMRRLALRRKA